MCSVYVRSYPVQVNATAAVSRPALTGGDEDIYAYGDSNPDPVWTPSGETVVFREKITSGHFAEIRKAELVNKSNETTTVVAKALKRGDYIT